MLRTLMILALLLATAAPAGAQNQFAVSTQRVEIPADGSTRRLAGNVQGERVEDLLFSAKAGQTLTLRLQVVHPAMRLELLAPGEDEPLFTGERLTPDYSGALPSDGIYLLRLYLTKGAAGRREKAKYVLGATLAP